MTTSNGGRSWNDESWGSQWLTAGTPEVPGFSDLRLIGSGGTGSVYRAVESRHRRSVAIKILDLRAGDSQRRAFDREVHAIARIEPHPNIITLLGSGVTPLGHPYLVLPFFDGGTFAQWIDNRGPLTWSAATDIAIKICSAVETVHRAGLIHRDIKPANVFIGVTAAHPVLGDFGIATGIEGVPTRTVQEAVTVGYTAPEILQDEPATPVSDIYSLGMTIFRLIQGLHAYYADNPEAVMRSVMNQSDAPHLSAGVPSSLDEAVTQALAKDPTKRTQSALELARNLQAVQADHRLPVTPLLITGEPGVLNQSTEAPPESSDEHESMAEEPVFEDDLADDDTPVDQAGDEPLVISTQHGSNLTADTDPDPAGSTITLTERPDAGAVLAAAINPVAESNPQHLLEQEPMEDDAAATVLTYSEDDRLQEAPLPPALDRPTEVRTRIPRTDLLAPKAQAKKSRWWSGLIRRSGNA